MNCCVQVCTLSVRRRASDRTQTLGGGCGELRADVISRASARVIRVYIKLSANPRPVIRQNAKSSITSDSYCMMQLVPLCKLMSALVMPAARSTLPSRGGSLHARVDYEPHQHMRTFQA
eukprot:6187403-Pleurochrysis_carterae.AAC.3